MISRRQLLRALPALAVTGASCRNAPNPATRPTPPPDPTPSQSSPGSILVLGGTGFLGPHFVRSAVAAGHRVTLFNRGKTNPHLFPDLRKLRGDRDGDLASLRRVLDDGERFHAVIDTSGYVPRVVRQSLELLEPATDRYLFVSSISVYADPSVVGLTEDAPVGTLDDPTVETITGETYGPLKAACERATEEVYGERATIIRPGLIVGPGDKSDRFTYWPVRCARGGKMAAPGAPDDPTQIIDARDLAEFMLGCATGPHPGRFNATGPARPLTMEELLQACIAASGSDAEPVWIAAETLAKHDVSPWMEMPAWVPPDGEAGGMLQVNIDRALAAGIRFRPLEETAADTLAWWNTLPEARRNSPRAGLPAEKEAELLPAPAASRPGRRRFGAMGRHRRAPVPDIHEDAA